jgi:hypothetical protein
MFEELLSKIVVNLRANSETAFSRPDPVTPLYITSKTAACKVTLFTLHRMRNNDGPSVRIDSRRPGRYAGDES